jgi:hypothetical protein
MVFPSAIPICHKNIIENHRAEPKHHDLSDIPNTESCVEAVLLKRLPARALLVGKRSNVLSQNIAQESQLEAFVQPIGGHYNFFVTMKEKNLAAPWVSVKLDE